MTSLKDTLTNRLATLKGGGGHASLEGWGGRELASFGILVSRRLLRGLYWKCRMGRVDGWILCERRVRVEHPQHVRAGMWLNLEEGCEIVGLSRQGITFGHRCTVGRLATIRPTNVLLDVPGEGLRMGDYSNIGAYAYIGCSGWIEIGSRVMMGPRVTLLSETHNLGRTDVPMKDQGVSRSFLRIEDDCWIGAGSTLLAGVTVGRGAVIGAGAVVSRDVPPGAVVAGVPARELRRRE